MIFHRLGLINENQRGFTLVELIIAVAITGIIVGAITMTIFQVFSGNARTSNHMTAVRQVQNAGYWISHDTQMAQQEPDIVTNPVTGELDSITLTWTDWETNNKHQVVYSLVDGELKREHVTYDAEGTKIGNETAFVAQHIDSTQTICQFVGGKLTLTVTATVGGWQPASETRIYEVIPRPST